jgi:O-antigen/teichoic acid export membrane protein
MGIVNNGRLAKIRASIFGGTLILSLAEIITNVLGLLLIPYFTENMSVEEYGIYSLTMSFVAVLGTLFNPGIVSVTQRLFFDDKYKLRQAEILGSALIFFLGFPFFYFILGLLFSGEISSFFGIPEEYMILAFGMALLIQPKRLWTFLYIKDKDYLSIFWVVVLSAIFMYVMVYVFFNFFGDKAMARSLGAFIVQMAFGVFMVFNFLNRGYIKFSKEILFLQLKLALPLALGVMLQEVFKHIDKFFLGSISGLHSLGLFSLTMQIVEIPYLLLIVLNGALTPLFFNIYSKSEEEKFKTLVTMYFQFVFLLICIALITMPFILKIFINDTFKIDPSFVVIMIMGSGLRMIGLLFIIIYSSAMSYKKLSLINAIYALVGPLISMLFIRNLGFEGAVYSYFTGSALLVLALWLFLKKPFVFISRKIIFHFLIFNILLLLIVQNNYLNIYSLSFFYLINILIIFYDLFVNYRHKIFSGLIS